MARDQVQVGVEGGPPAENPPSQIEPAWQRWNDYGIGLLLEGGNTGGQKGELKQAEPVFLKVAELGIADGWVNLGRVYQKEGRIPEALSALEKAAKHEKPSAPWVINWLSGQINARNGAFDEAIESFQSVLGTRIPQRKIDLSLDYEVNNELAFALYARAMQEPFSTPERVEYLKKAVAAYRRTLSIDSENVTAHHALGLAYGAAPWGENRAASMATHGTAADGNATEPSGADSLLKMASTAVDPNLARGRGWKRPSASTMKSCDSSTARAPAINHGSLRSSSSSRYSAQPGTKRRTPRSSARSPMPLRSHTNGCTSGSNRRNRRRKSVRHRTQEPGSQR